MLLISKSTSRKGIRRKSSMRRKRKRNLKVRVVLMKRKKSKPQRRIPGRYKVCKIVNYIKKK